MLKFAEEEVARRGGKLLLVETSSQETYGGTIQFYERTGYELVGRIKDYYKPDDDKLIFAKVLTRAVADDMPYVDQVVRESGRVEASGAA